MITSGDNNIEIQEEKQYGKNLLSYLKFGRNKTC